MSNDPKEQNDAAQDAGQADEITEEQLESVSGGILIGLNQPSLGIKLEDKQLTAQLGDSTVSAIDTHIKYFKK